MEGSLKKEIWDIIRVANMRIFSYVVTRDHGFAPNPFHGVCTLATCKAVIRGVASVGDIVIGTRGSPRQNEIVYFMEIDEILSFDQYWRDPRFQVKKPIVYGSMKYAHGDNIYHRGEDGEWIQEYSHHTFPDGNPSQENIDTDTSRDKVLIGYNFCYWGDRSIRIPPELKDVIKEGRWHRSCFDEDFKRKVKDWLMRQDRGVIGDPMAW
ncbi:hypothetical protein [Halomonas caseinilytica]|uniref:Nmad2 family putative nucleotide modification protein n=1 Tax=Halomonas caseinilytica TaxID=438744 RepID=UPI000AAC7FDF|nr:hypothetical protein [Halomonas caseinilytica]